MALVFIPAQKFVRPPFWRHLFFEVFSFSRFSRVDSCGQTNGRKDEKTDRHCQLHCVHSIHIVQIPHKNVDTRERLRRDLNPHFQCSSGENPSRKETCPEFRYSVRSIKKSRPATRHGGAWRERKYSSYSFTTSALDGVSGQHHAPAALYPQGKDPRYPLDRRLGGPQSRSGHRG
jgi:hypothetical protein